MVFNFDDFELEDGAVLGGLLGFAEEAGKDEDREEENSVETIEIEEAEIPLKILNDVDMRLLRNQDPDFFDHIIKKVAEQERKFEAIKRQRQLDQEKQESEEILREIKEEHMKLKLEEAKNKVKCPYCSWQGDIEEFDKVAEGVYRCPWYNCKKMIIEKDFIQDKRETNGK